MITINNKNYLNTTEAATLLNVSKPTIRRWGADGKLTKVKLSYKQVYYRESEIEGKFENK